MQPIKTTLFKSSDGYAGLNKIVSYLQDERNIPMYLASIEPEEFGYKDDLEVWPEKEQEPIVFTGNLEDYLKKK